MRMRCRGTRCALIAASAVGLAVMTLVGAGTVWAGTRSIGFSIPGKHKHTISFGGQTGEFGGATVSASPNALNDRKNIAYSSYHVEKASVTAKHFAASFGTLGKVDMKFRATSDPKKIPVPRGCKGKPGSTVKGRFRGIAKFVGEGGYTKVTAHRATGHATEAPVINGCKASKPVHTVSFSAGEAPDYDVGVGATRTLSSGKTLFNANVSRTKGKVAIFRLINRVGAQSQFTYNAGLTSAQLHPPAPFKGSGSYTEGGPFTGNLSVSFPGEKNVPLAGPNFSGNLYEYP